MRKRRRGGRRAVLMLVAAAAVGAMNACMDRKISDRDLVLVDTTEAMELIEGRKQLLGLAGEAKGVWVDPRSERAFREGHIPGAISLPLREVTARHKELKDYAILIVYGDGYKDPIANAMSKRLMELRFSDVRTLRGGLRAWTDAGFELETDEG